MKPRLYWSGSIPQPHETSRLPRDVYIADIVGLRTYQRLWYNFPQLYTQLNECSEKAYFALRDEGTNSNVTDFIDLHLDSDYTPEDLKYDLQMMCYGFEPRNPHAKKLLNSSAKSVGYSCSMGLWVGLLVLIVIYWIVVVISLWLVALSLMSHSCGVQRTL